MNTRVLRIMPNMTNNTNLVKKRVYKKMRTKQKILHACSKSILNQLNENSSNVETLEKLAIELSYVCRDLIEIQTYMENIDTFVVFNSHDNATNDDLEL